MLRFIASVLLAASLTPEPIQLTLTPQVGYAPLTVRARLTIEPDYLNYGVCLQWEHVAYSGVGCWSLDGQYAARTHYYELKSLPFGDYAVRATLLRVRDSRQTPSLTIRVLEGLPH